MSKIYKITHFFVFPSVIIFDPSILKDIISLFFPDIRIGTLTPEKTFQEYYIAFKEEKSSRLDVKLSDDKNIIISEMLVYEDQTIEIRIQRYIASEIVDEIKRGKKDQLAQTYVLLITALPFNGESYAISRYRLTDEYGEKKKLESSPEILVVFYNGVEEGLNEEQKDFLKYLRTGELHENSSLLVNKAHHAVMTINEDKYWRKELMTLENIRKLSENKGREEGRKEGINIDRTELLKRQISAGKSLEEAAEVLMLSKEEVDEIVESGYLELKS